VIIFIIGSVITYFNSFSQTPLDRALFTAIQQDNIVAVKSLIQSGANVNSMISDANVYSMINNKTPLTLATFNSSLEVIKFLISSGANPQLKDGFGLSPIMRAAKYLRVDVVRYFLGLNVNYQGVIYFAVDGLNITEQFNKYKGSNQEQDKINCMEIIRSVLSKNPYVIDEYINSETPLLRSMGTYCFQENIYKPQYLYHYPVDLIEFLINNGASLNLYNGNGETPLMKAVINGNRDAIFLLLNSSPINKQDNNGCTALMHAINTNGRCLLGGFAKLVNYWLLQNNDQFNSNPNWQMKNVSAMRLEMIYLLLSHPKINVNMQDNYGNSALHYVITHKWDPGFMFSSSDFDQKNYINMKEIIVRLLQKGANINLMNKENKSPLILAIELSQNDMNASNGDIQNILLNTK
jgi:ankyrin repeat protein